MREKKCQNCGAENTRKSNYCRQCGSPLQQTEGQNVQCPDCEMKVSSADRFCPGCGRRLSGDHEPVVEEAHWRRTEGDFACHLDPGTINRALKGGLVIEQGTHALLFQDGKLVEQLSPGRHELQTLKEKLGSLFGSRTTHKAVLVDAGVAPLHFMVGGLKTSDPLFVKLECEMIIQVIDPDLFYLNLFKNRNSLGLQEMASWMTDEVRDALAEEIAKLSVENIGSDRETKDRLAHAARKHLQKSLQMYGLDIVQFRTLSLSHARYDALQAQEEDVVLQVWEKESELSGRRRLFDVESEERRQEIYEQTKKAEHEEDRVQVYSRLRKAIMTGKMDEVRSKEELDAFLDEIDTKRLLREEEKEELKRGLEEKKEDHERSRQHMLNKLDVEQKVELRRLELMGEQELDEEMLKLKLQKERTQLEHDLAVERDKLEAQRNRRLQEHRDQLQQDLEQARTEQEKEEIRLELKKKKWEFGQSVQERQRSEKLKHEQEKMLQDLERQEQELTLRLKEQSQTHQEDMERLKAMDGISTEALIAHSGSDQAKILADLKKTELLGNWSEEQILAEAAKNSPEVAKAFQERFQAQSTDEMKELYERLIRDKDQFLDQYKEEQRQTRQDMKDITVESLRSSQPNSQVVYPPTGQQGMHVRDSGPTCPECGGSVKPRARFCHHCGQALKE